MEGVVSIYIHHTFDNIDITGFMCCKKQMIKVSKKIDNCGWVGLYY